MVTVRLLMVLAFLAGPPIIVLISGWQGRTSDVVYDLATAPREVAGLRAVVDDRLPENVLRAGIEPSAYLMRTYRRSGVYAYVYAAFYSGHTSTSAHDPHLCYPAQGWDIEQLNNVTIPLEDGEALRSKFFLARSGHAEEVVLHWFQPTGRWPLQPGLEPLARVLEAFRGNKAYAFVRVSIPLAQLEQPVAEQRLIEIAADLAPWAREVLDAARANAARRTASVREEGPQPGTDRARNTHREPPPGAGERA